MIKQLFQAAVLCLVTSGLSFAQQGQPSSLTYPVTKKVDQADDYFGTRVADPYRWLEDDRSEETGEWVKAQNDVTSQYLSAIPYRAALKERLSETWDYPKMSTPSRHGDMLFYFYNTGMQNQSVLFMRDDKNPNGKAILDPNTLSSDGTVSITGFKVSHDGKYLAYSISRSGSDWGEIYIMDLKKLKTLDDHIQWVKFSGMAWHGKGFYYSRYDEPAEGSALKGKNEFHKVYFHKVGTPQSKDQLIYENKDFPLRNYGVGVSDDERYMYLYETESTSGNSLYCKDLRRENQSFVLLGKGFDYDYDVVGNVGDSIIIRTNFDAPNYHLISKIPTVHGQESFDILINQEADMVLESAHMAKGRIVVKYLQKATNFLTVFRTNGDIEDKISLPALGSITDFNSNATDDVAYYSFTSFTYPTQVFEYSFEHRASRSMFIPETLFNQEDYETKQITYLSSDKTPVTMFLVYKKGLTLNGNNPTYLYGYGGFNISIKPVFSSSRMVFLENGGLMAFPNLRGGGEYGEAWHQAGTKDKKQNVFNDFIAAAEYLINQKYTKSEKLAIAGGSNGGLLVGACMTQRPELFKVALPAVGVMDMLRFHKFTIGWAWKTDYGSSEDQDGFKILYRYSPLHNLKEGVHYPATLVTTADHDDRVVPAHSFKFIATLQEKQAGSDPVLIRIQTKAGHGSGKPTSARIEEATDIFAFTFKNLGMEMVVPPARNRSQMDIKKKKSPGFVDSPEYKKAKPKVSPFEEKKTEEPK